MVARVARRIACLLERRGLGPESDPIDSDPLAEEQPLLAMLYGASINGRIATGRRAGQPVLRVGDRIDADDLPALEGERCASASGVSLHANVAVPARDRRRLERLCRYVAWPPVATEWLSRLEDGRLLYRLKHRWRDGTTHIVFEQEGLVEKLAALVPPPRFHLVRYHGILGPCAGQRRRVVPCEETQARRQESQPLAGPGGARIAASDEDAIVEGRGSRDVAPGRRAERVAGGSAAAGTTSGVASEPSPEANGTPPRTRRLAWAELLRRVFAVDVLECPRCGGRMRLLATIHPPEATRAILECLGLRSRAPPLAQPWTEPAVLGLETSEFDASA